MYHTDVVKLILQSGTTLRLHATPISQTFIRSDGPYRSSGRLIPRVSPTDHLSNNNNNNNYTTRYLSQLSDKQASTSYIPSNSFRTCLTNVPGVPEDVSSSNFDVKSYASVCASNNSRSTDGVARRVNRRLTVREGRQRHLNARNLEPKVECMQPDTSLNPYCHHSDSAPDGAHPERSRSSYSTSTACSKGSTQTYASVAAQRFGITLNQLCTNPLPSNPTSQNNLFFPAHRRSLEKPLIRQLSERQHRALFLTTDDGSPSHNPAIYSARNVFSSNSSHQSPRSDHHQQHSVFNFHRPSLTVTSSSSGSSLSSSSWYSGGGELSSHSSPGSGSPSVPSVPRSYDATHPPLNPFQQARFGSLRAPSNSATQFVNPHMENSSVKLPFACQQVTKSAFIPQNRNASQCRHSDPVRPIGKPRGARSICSVVSNTQNPYTFTVSVQASVSNPSQNPVQNVDLDKFSVQANALVSSGQVRLRRHSHRFAVQHVASPSSPAESGDEKSKNHP
ncbi:unnamed protein product [Heterobilharzia americana]|nr:unnamed protein product [Heterobilharzia americana]